MRILLLSTGGKIGGEETFTRNLALSLMSKGHYVEVAPGGKVQREDLEKRGIKICPVDITGRKPFALYKAAGNLAKYAESNNFDVIHSQAVGPAIMGVLAKKFHHCQIPWMWHNHGITDFAYKHIVKRLNGLDSIIANSDYVKESLKGHGVKPGVITRIHNGINYEDFYVSEADRKANRERLCEMIGLKKDSKNPIIIYVGRLSPEKGVEVLVDGFAELRQSHPDSQCVLVGDGVERENLKSQVAKNGCTDNVHFLGFRSDIKELVSGSDILVLPSHIETFSLTTLQAFASGTPCVCSDVGGTPEQILDKFSGRLFPNNDTSALAECLSELIESPAKMKDYADKAQQLSHNYLNTDRMTDEIIGVYETLTEKSK